MKDWQMVLGAIALIVFGGLMLYAGWKIATGISCPVIEGLNAELAEAKAELVEAKGERDAEKKEKEANLVVIKATNMLASFYGQREHGRQTASGETFDMNALTAACRTIKSGTILILENLSNGKICPVRINDFGPAIQGRDLDVSHAVAERLGMISDGVVKLRVYETFRMRLSKGD